MISANALARNNKATLTMIDVVEEEKPRVIQLFGQNIDNLVTWCKTGPANSRVDEFELSEENSTDEFENFEVRY